MGEKIVSFTEFVLFYILNKKNIFNASDLIFIGAKCYTLHFLEQGILLEMFYFKLLKKSNIVVTFTTSEY